MMRPGDGYRDPKAAEPDPPLFCMHNLLSKRKRFLCIPFLDARVYPVLE